MDPVVYAAQALCKIVHQVKREMTCRKKCPYPQKKEDQEMVKEGILTEKSAFQNHYQIQ
jgi:hypothetical protein